MSQFTQLNLQGNSGSKPVSGSTKPGAAPLKTPPTLKPTKKHHDKKAMALGASFAAAALIAAVTLGTNGCSKTNKPAIAAPMATQPITSPMVQTTPAVVTPSTPTKTAKKTSRQLILFAYKNAGYGISFLYPKEYKMSKGEKSKIEWTGLGPVETNFIQPGGSTLAGVKLPDTMFKGSDLDTAFFAVNVNSKMTAEQCTQFAFQDQKTAAATDMGADQDDAPVEILDMKPAKIQPAVMKIGAAEYTEANSSGGNDTKHADAKYYHVYENAACYEFVLGVETSEGKADVKPVDHSAVFAKLNWMLSTVKIAPTELQTKAEVTTSTSDKPADKAEKTEPATPKAASDTASIGNTTTPIDAEKN